MMGKVRVTLPNGQIVDGKIIANQTDLNGHAFLIADGKQYSGLEAVNQGLSDLINDPFIDLWLNKVTG